MLLDGCLHHRQNGVIDLRAGQQWIDLAHVLRNVRNPGHLKFRVMGLTGTDHAGLAVVIPRHVVSCPVGELEVNFVNIIIST